MPTFTLCLLASSADNLCKQFGPRCLIWIQTVRHSDGINKRIFEKDDFEKYQQMTKTDEKLPSIQRVKFTNSNCIVNLRLIEGD